MFKINLVYLIQMMTSSVMSFGDFLHQAVAQIGVDLHLGILSKFKGERLKLIVLHSLEDIGQATTYHVVKVHQVAVPFMVGQLDEASQFIGNSMTA